MMYVFLPRGGKDQDVVHVDKHVLFKHVSYHVVNVGLEDGRGVGEAKGHDS